MRAARSQTRIDFIKPASRRPLAKRAEETLSESRIVNDRILVVVALIDEHDVEVRGVAELPATELAEREDRECTGTFRHLRLDDRERGLQTGFSDRRQL